MVFLQSLHIFAVSPFSWRPNCSNLFCFHLKDDESKNEMEKLETAANLLAEEAKKDKPSAAANQKGVLFVR